MALLLDRIESAGYLRTIDGYTHRRSAIVTGVSTVHPAAVCFQATQVSGMPQVGDSHPADPQSICTSVEAIGIEESSDTVRVLITYSSAPSGGNLIGGGGGFSIENSTSLQSETTELCPGADKSPLIVKLKDKKKKLFKYQGSIEFKRPVQVVTLSGSLKKGASTEKYEKLVGMVNRDRWKGREPGSWLVAGVDTATVDSGRSYSLKIQVIARADDDWSEYVIGRDGNTDQWFLIDPVLVGNLKSAKYKYGILYPNGNAYAGIIRVCPFETTQFAAVLGSGK